MRRVAATLGIVATIALANPARAALPLQHNFFDEPTPRPTPTDFNMIGNLSHAFGATTNAFGESIVPSAVPVSPSLQLGDHENGLPLGRNGIPLFNIRFDPEHDFYNALTAQVARPSVPESSTWTMLLLGFAAIGFRMRRNRRDFGLRWPNIA